jgi:hypothetical protein
MDKSFNSQEFLNLLARELVSSFDKADKATTPGLVGSAKEEAVRKKLESILPSKVGVKSGCVIDSYGKTSNQIDLILYEKDLCPVFCINGDNNTNYIPCECVIAVGEIKSTLNKRELFDAVEKIARIKRLQRYVTDTTLFRKYGTSQGLQGVSSEALDPVNNPFDQIYGFILCDKFGIKEPTLAKHYIEATKANEGHLSPNLLASLRSGMVIFNEEERFLESRENATRIGILSNPDGEFQFLVHKLIAVINNGRTSAILPNERYILASKGNINTVVANFYNLE